MEFVDNTPSYVDYNKAVTQSPPGLGSYHFSDKAWQARNDWATMYYQNAYNTALLNYQNEYNSPLQQMLRYQEAGLSPWLVSDSGNMGSTHAGASPSGRFTSPTTPQVVGAVNQSINTLNDVLKTAQGIYDYVNYGRDLSAEQKQLAHFNSQIAQYRALGEEAESVWKRYWNLGEEAVPEVSTEPTVQSSPRAKYMYESTERISSQVDQLKALVDVLYPSQKEANEARASLTMYQKQVLEGQKDAILQISTGNDTADAILKMICFWLLGK